MISARERLGTRRGVAGTQLEVTDIKNGLKIAVPKGGHESPKVAREKLGKGGAAAAGP